MILVSCTCEWESLLNITGESWRVTSYESGTQVPLTRHMAVQLRVLWSFNSTLPVQWFTWGGRNTIYGFLSKKSSNKRRDRSDFSAVQENNSPLSPEFYCLESEGLAEISWDRKSGARREVWEGSWIYFSSHQGVHEKGVSGDNDS